jgi:hypothetical protein
MIKVNTKNKIEDNVSSAIHKSTYDTDSINRALERAIKDDKFVSNAIKLLNGIHFPAFKNNIVDYVRSITTNTDMISLFESLDGYIKFKDPYHVQKALEENIPAKKKEYQITDKTREQPVVRTHNTTTTIDKNIKEREEAVLNRYEERKDYAEVTPTAMSDFICSVCGKTFQNQYDLVHHRNFERELREEGELEEQGVKDREKGINQQQQKRQLRQQQQPSISKQQPIERVGDITGELPTNITTDKEIASKMANLLEGLEFPVTKEEVEDHINEKRKSKVMKNNRIIIIVDTVLQAIQNNLQEGVQYNNVYEIEKAAKLVRKKR